MVSIIIPVYNVSDYIIKCTDSLRRQTYSDIEVLLIDDYSTDGTSALCDKIADSDCRFFVFHQSHNQGVSAARNTGIEFARGEYITFIDGDDWVCQDYVEQLVSSMSHHDTDFAMVGMYDYYSSENCSPDTLHANYLPNLNDPDQLLRLLKTERLPGPVCKLYKKTIIDNYKIRFRSNISFAEDKEFNAKYLSYCQSAYISSYVGYYYRRSVVGSLSKRIHKDRFDTEYHIWEIWFSSLERRNCFSDEISRYFANELYYILLDSIVFAEIHDCIIPAIDKKYVTFLRKRFRHIIDKNIFRKTSILFNGMQLYRIVIKLKLLK